MPVFSCFLNTWLLDRLSTQIAYSYDQPYIDTGQVMQLGYRNLINPFWTCGCILTNLYLMDY